MQLAHNNALCLTQIDQVKSSETYYCPSCGARCVIKRGTSNRPHFAHRQGLSCQSGESQQHRAMKTILQSWIAQTDQVHSEFYFKTIKRRADLYVPENHHIIEYQLSDTSQRDLQKRTLAYHSIGLRVTWLIGELKATEKTVYISRFTERLISYHPQLGYYLVAFSPTKQQFLSYDNLQQKSGRFFFVRQRKINIGSLTYRQLSRWLVGTKRQPQEQQRHYSELQRQTQINRFITKRNLQFREQLYRQKEHLQYFPYFVGIDLPEQWLLNTPAFVWQYRLIQYVQQQQTCSSENLQAWWLKMIEQKCFVTMKPDVHQIVMLYVRVLIQIKKLTYRNGQYQLVEPVVFNRIEHTREWARLTKVVKTESER